VRHRTDTLHRIGIGLPILCLLLFASERTAGAALPEEALQKLDPRLTPAAERAGAEILPVWIAFADKGESGPAGLMLALDRARRELSPRSLARRTRLGISPLVDYRDLPLAPAYLDALRERGITPFGTSRWLNQVAVMLPAGRLAEVAQLPFVDRLRPVERATRMRDVPDDASPIGRAAAPDCGDCARATNSINYGLNTAAVQQLNVPAVHDSGYIGTGVLVCIIDDGFNFHYTHEALAPVVIAPGFERDFVDSDWSAQDTVGFTCCTHGAEVMGCIAGNKPGTYVGTAPGAKYALARTEVDVSETPVEMVYWGMAAEWADSLGADEITTSLGYNQFDGGVGNYTYANMDGRTTIVSQNAEIAASKGILVLAAAGNEGGNSWGKILAPADVNGDSLIAVGAVNSSGVRTGFSSVGPSADGRIKPDLMALGQSNSVIVPNGTPNAYGTGSGTSFATPLLAGLAACLIQARPHFAPQSIIRALRETASRAASPDTFMGYGIPDGLKALRWTIAGLAVEGEPGGALGIRLVGPNPRQSCDAASVVRFALGAGAPASAAAHVDVFDALGRRVRSLYSGAIGRGQWHEVAWDGRDGAGSAVPSGLYFISFDAAGRRSSLRVVSLR
jgi:serine protease AprX